MTIGERIRATRKTAGLTQAQLAEQSGVASISIHQYESGKRQPRLKQLQAISKALNVDWTDLVPEENQAQIVIDHVKEGLRKGEDKTWEVVCEEDKELIAFNDYLENMGYRLVIELSTFESVNPNHYWTLYDNRNGKRYFVPSEKLDRLMSSINSYTKYQVGELISELEEAPQNIQGE